MKRSLLLIAALCATAPVVRLPWDSCGSREHGFGKCAKYFGDARGEGSGATRKIAMLFRRTGTRRGAGNGHRHAVRKYVPGARGQDAGRCPATTVKIFSELVYRASYHPKDWKLSVVRERCRRRASAPIFSLRSANRPTAHCRDTESPTKHIRALVIGRRFDRVRFDAP